MRNCDCLIDHPLLPAEKPGKIRFILRFRIPVDIFLGRQLRRLSQSGELPMDAIFALLTMPKANQRE